MTSIRTIPRFVPRRPPPTGGRRPPRRRTGRARPAGSAARWRSMVARSPRAAGPVSAGRRRGRRRCRASRRRGRGRPRAARPRGGHPLDLAEQGDEVVRGDRTPRRGTRARSSSATSNAPAAESRHQRRGDRVAGHREPGAGRAAAPRRARRWAAPRAGGSPPAGRGGRARRGRASRRGGRPPPRSTGSIDAATSATAASGVAITTRSTPARPRRPGRRRGRAAAARPTRPRPGPAAERRRPARPGPMIRSRGAARPEPCRRREPCSRSEGPTLVDLALGAVVASRRARGRARGRRAGAITKRRSNIRGWGTCRSGSSTVPAVDPEDVDVERAGPPALRRAPGRPPTRAGGTRRAAARAVRSVSSSTTRLRYGPWPPGPPTGSVSYTGDTATTPRRASRPPRGGSAARSPRLEPEAEEGAHGVSSRPR